VIPWTWDHPRFLLRSAAARTPSQAKAGFRVLRAARVPFRVPFSKPLPCPAVRVHSSDLAVTAGELNAGAGVGRLRACPSLGRCDASSAGGTRFC